MSNSLIRAIKQDIADALLADPYFDTIPVMPIVQNDVLNEIQQGQYKANPVTVLIDWLSLHNANPDNPGPWFNQGVFLVEILEIPALNISGPDVDEVAENVANTLHLAMLQSQNAAVVDGIGKADNDEFGRNVRQVRITFPFGFTPRVLPSVETVTIQPLTQGDQTVTLSCVTPGAAIFYTLDGSYPAPRNPAAVYYQPYMPLLNENGQQLLSESGQPLSVTNALSVLAGQLLKARAWLAGFTSAQPDTNQFQY